MFAVVGTAQSSGVVVALIVGVSIIPVIFLHFRGAGWRESKVVRQSARQQASTARGAGQTV